jgi:hypothetical protein
VRYGEPVVLAEAEYRWPVASGRGELGTLGEELGKFLFTSYGLLALLILLTLLFVRWFELSGGFKLRPGSSAVDIQS